MRAWSMCKKSLSVIIYIKHHFFNAKMSVWKQPNTFLSCSTRNDLCLNRPENVPQVVSPLLMDMTEIRRTVACSGTPGPVAAVPPAPAGTVPSRSAAVAPKAREPVEAYTGYTEYDDDYIEDEYVDDEMY